MDELDPDCILCGRPGHGYGLTDFKTIIGLCYACAPPGLTLPFRIQGFGEDDGWRELERMTRTDLEAWLIKQFYLRGREIADLLEELKSTR